MKKFGFTLAELMIALSIIGIAAVLVAPIVVDLIPDTNKARVLKYNSQIESVLVEMFNDSSIYAPRAFFAGQTRTITVDGDGNQCEGIACMSFGEGQNFISELQSRLRINAEGFAPDYSHWDIRSAGENYLIQIDVNPDNNDGCAFWALNCDIKKADIFIFEIDKYGNLSPVDHLTNAYLQNPLNLNSRKEDFAKAEELRSGN